MIYVGSWTRIRGSGPGPGPRVSRSDDLEKSFRFTVSEDGSLIPWPELPRLYRLFGKKVKIKK